MAANLEYVNDIRKIDLTCDESLNLRSGIFLRFVAAVDELHAAEPINLITLATAAPAGEFDYTVTTVSGPSITYRLITVGDAIHFSVTTNGTVWVPDRLALNTALRQIVSELILSQSTTAIEVDYF